MKKRVLSFLLAMAMVISLLPMAVFAEGEETTPALSIELVQRNSHIAAGSTVAVDVNLTSTAAMNVESFGFAVSATGFAVSGFAAEHTGTAACSEGVVEFTYDGTTPIAVEANKAVTLGTITLTAGEGTTALTGIELTGVAVNEVSAEGAEGVSHAVTVITTALADSAYSKGGHGEEDWTAVTQETGLPTASGHYFLTEDIVLSAEHVYKNGIDVVLCLNGHTVKQTAAKRVMSLATHADKATLTICDCSAHTDAQGNYYAGMLTGGNDNSNAGAGAVLVPKYCELTLEDGIIYDCKTSTAGGAIVLQKKNEDYPVDGLFTMNGGMITGNKCTNTKLGGGAIYSDGTFIMNGGTISGNEAAYSGGAIYSNTVLTITGGVFSGNTAAGSHGGAIYAYNAEIANAQFIGNKVTRKDAVGGGALYLRGSDATIENCTFRENESCVSGSAIGVTGNCVVTIKNCTITGNINNTDEDAWAGALYAAGSSVVFEIEGKTVIDGNYTVSGERRIETNIKLQNNTVTRNNDRKWIELGALGDGAKLSVGLTYTSTEKVGDCYADYLLSNVFGLKEGVTWDSWDSQWLVLEDFQHMTLSFNMEKQTFTVHEKVSHPYVEGEQAWTPLAGAIPTEAGYYYLTQDITLSEEVVINGGQTITLCLNGYTVSGGDACRLFHISNGSNVTICDCHEAFDCEAAGKLTGGAGGAICVEGSTLSLIGIEASGNTTLAGASVLYGEGESKLYITDCTITGNTSTGEESTAAGAVYVSGSGTQLYVSGATVIDDNLIQNGAVERNVYLKDGAVVYADGLKLGTSIGVYTSEAKVTAGDFIQKTEAQDPAAWECDWVFYENQNKESISWKAEEGFVIGHFHKTADGVYRQYTAWANTDTGTTYAPYASEGTHYYYLPDDLHVTANQASDKNISGTAEIYLCMNGKTMDCVYSSTKSVHAIIVTGSAKLVLSDCAAVLEDGKYVSGGKIMNAKTKGNGGAVFVNESASAEISRVAFTNNEDVENTMSYGGGAIQVRQNASMQIESCLFANNTSYGGGGAIAVRGDAQVTVKKTVFDNNDGTGDQVYKTDGSANTNMPATNGGAIFVTDRTDKGYTAAKAPTLSLENCTFKNCDTKGNGGAIYVQDSVSDARIPAVTITNCTFTDNTSAAAGGAVYVASGSFEATGCTFSKNTATTNGGAIFVQSGTMTLAGTTSIQGNTTDNDATTGGVYVNTNGKLNLSGSLTMSNNDGNDIVLVGDKAVTMVGAGTDISLSQGDLKLDLAGYDVETLTLSNGTLYGMDSKTNDYDCEDAEGYGKIGTVSAAVAKTSFIGSRRYVAITEDAGTSFHRYYAAITKVNLRPAKAGAGYTMEVSGDQMAVEAMTGYGMTITLKDSSGEVIKNQAGVEAVFKTPEIEEMNVVAGEFTKQQLLIDNILTTSENPEIGNADRGSWKVCVQPYVQFGDQTVDVASRDYTFQRLVEITDTGMADATVSENMQGYLKTLLVDYGVKDLDWSTDNLEALAGLTTES